MANLESSKHPHNFKDIAGERFGKITAINYIGKRHWQCECDCGTTLSIRIDHLIRAETLSCGCLRAHQDLTGQTFGAWTALECVGNNAHGSPLYKCLCSCGTLMEHQSSNLLSGSTRSCGCIERTTNYIGRRFGRLEVLLRIPSNHKHRKPAEFVCACDCGNHIRAFVSNITAGRTQSCGCLARESVSNSISRYTTTHGKSRTRIYSIYQGMMQRCHNPNASNYDRYGGRGIEVCAAWRESFEQFYLDMGDPPSPTYSLDRYPNPSGPYCKTNCRWATPKQQSRNREVSRMITFQSQTLCVSEWSELTGIRSSTLINRIDAGWDVVDTLTVPSRGRRQFMNKS